MKMQVIIVSLVGRAVGRLPSCFKLFQVVYFGPSTTKMRIFVLALMAIAVSAELAVKIDRHFPCNPKTGNLN